MFECQHGPDECFGNKVQGCMLARIPDQDTVISSCKSSQWPQPPTTFFLQQMNYVACQMAALERSHQPCVEAFGVSFNDILQCVESEFATRQQLEYEQITRERFLLLLAHCAKTSSTVYPWIAFFSSSSLCSAGFGANELGADHRLQWKDFRTFAHRPSSTAQRNPLRHDSQHESGLCG
jgi:hypothetical protein